MRRTWKMVSILCLLSVCGIGHAQIDIPPGFPTAETTGLAGIGVSEESLTSVSKQTVTVDGTGARDTILIFGWWIDA